MPTLKEELQELERKPFAFHVPISNWVEGRGRIMAV